MWGVGVWGEDGVLYFKRHMAFRKADESLVCWGKFDSFFKPAL
jgi:hypothetical protein